MGSHARKFFPIVSIVILCVALAWALRTENQEPADYTFSNGTEIKSVDPAIVTGQPEGVIIRGLYEGLVDWDPKDLHPIPGVAERWELSEDGRTYTFHFRENARWSNGEPVIADDFLYSFRRFLNPMIGAEYAFLLYYVKNAEKYNRAEVENGDSVDVELDHPPRDAAPFARNEILKGSLISKKEMTPIDAAPPETVAVYEVQIADEVRRFSSEPERLDATDVERCDQVLLDADEIGLLRVVISGNEILKGSLISTTEMTPIDAEKVAVYEVQIADEVRRFSSEPERLNATDVERCDQVLLDADEIGLRVINERTLEIELENPVPYFINLLGFYPLFPVNQKCIEQWGYPSWTRPDKIITNGPYVLHSRKIRDRIRMKRNPHYWDQDNIHLETIDALAIESQTTELNLYMTGKIDYFRQVPATIIPELLAQNREDFQPKAYLAVYYYEINIGETGLDKLAVRKALSLAVNRREVVDKVTRAGQIPAYRLVPPGIADYEEAKRRMNVVEQEADMEANIAEAKRLMAEAGYADGKGFPKIELLYNTNDVHAQIAELLQSQWKESLGINVELVNKEWGTYLADRSGKKYYVARAGWIGDYADPNTFLDLFLSNSPQNRTGWKNEQFDTLLNQTKLVKLRPEEQAAIEKQVRSRDDWSEAEHERLLQETLERERSVKRMKMFVEAEQLLIDSSPMIPLYYYVSQAMIRPYLKGFYQNVQDTHPFKGMSIDKEHKKRVLKAEGLR